MKLGFGLALATGVRLVLTAQAVHSSMADRVYVVRSVQSHYPHENENT